MFLSWRFKPWALWGTLAVGLGGGLYAVVHARELSAWLAWKDTPKQSHSMDTHILNNQPSTLGEILELMIKLLEGPDGPHLRGLVLHHGVDLNAPHLDLAIFIFHEVTVLYPPGSPHCPLSPITLHNALATLLEMQFQGSGDLADLNESINHCTKLLALCTSGHPNYSSFLNNLATAYWARFKVLGVQEELDEAIHYFYQLLAHCSVDHPAHSIALNNLAGALQARFEQQGDMGDLDEAISYHQRALDLHPTGHPHRPGTLNNLGTALKVRFEQLGDLQDLNDAIGYHEQALILSPPGHPDRSLCLNNLGNGLKNRFGQHGNLEDLDKAITYHQEALSLRPPSHPTHSSSLSNLGNTLWARFEELGYPQDLDEAITYLQQATGLHPTRHPSNSASLNNLANALQTRFEQQGDMGDLDKAITYHQQVLVQRPIGHPSRFSSLNNLAKGLHTRFEQQGHLGDLDEAITYHRQALGLYPTGHPSQSGSLNNLASALKLRFKQQGHLEDLDAAIHLYEEAHVILPHHPYQVYLTQGLATAYLSHPQANQLADKAFSLHQQAANHVPGGSQSRLFASLVWIKEAKQHFHRSEMLAFSTALALVQQYITLHPTIQSQLSALARVPSSLGSDAAACAIQECQLETAVELLEQGRAVLWRTVGGYRSNLETLKEVGHWQLAQEFRRLGNLLEYSTLSSMQNTQRSGQSAADEAQRYHQIAKEWDHVINQIQQIDGFSHFLKATPFRTLQLSASHGPVIIVNVSQSCSDAIILCNGHDPSHIALPCATLKALQHLAFTLQMSLGSGNPRKCATGVNSVLRSLWDWVAQPIVHHLYWLPLGSHIWWCPTSLLCSLPLHAAGPWKAGQKNLPDLFLSSYTPTLTALHKAQVESHNPSAPPTLLAIGVSELGDGSRKLGHVKEELDQIRGIMVKASQDINFLENDHATRHTILAGLQQHSWIHFSCHGQQDFNEPFNSHFLLNDMPLTLHDIIQAHIPNAELAFLSACHTASGNQKRPDETIHLAAALQFSGFKTVIGTLWAMDDRDGPDVAKAFYEYMFRNGTNEVDHKDAAQALKHVVDALRRKGVSADRWANFIHIGP